MKETNQSSTFYLYRYQLHVNYPFQIELSIENGCKTPEELKNKRPEFMRQAICDLPTHDFKGEYKFTDFQPYNDNTQFLFCEEANRKKRITKDHKDIDVSHQPFAWIAVDTDPSVQVIAIAPKSDLNHETVASHLSKSLQASLAKRGLTINVATIKRDDSFWNFVTNHKDLVKKVNFSINPPNMPALSRMVGKQVMDLATSLGAKRGDMSFSAGKSQVLQLSKEDSNLKGLVTYVQSGGGDVWFKLKGSKRKLYPENQQETLSAFIHQDDDLFAFSSGTPDASILTRIRSNYILDESEIGH